MDETPSVTVAPERGPISHWFKQALPYALFVAIAALGAALAYALYDNEKDAHGYRMRSDTDEIARALELGMQQNISLLRAARALIETDPRMMTPDRFATFFSKIDFARVYGGVQAVGFAPLTPVGQEAQLVAQYQLPRAVHPTTEQSQRAPIVMIEPRNERNAAALGFDMYSEARRRAAMDAAVANDLPTMSAPVTLAQEITSDKQRGFLVYLPTRDARANTTSFVYAGFRAADFIAGSLRGAMMERYLFRLADVSDGDEALYTSPGFESRSSAASYSQTIMIAGRKWRLTVLPTTPGLDRTALMLISAVLIGALLLGGLFAYSYRAQVRAATAAQTLAQAQQAMLDERELLLHEMKHRIKNSIARIAAIARSTARSSATLTDFTKDFTGRINAMAAAQDVLTRSRWERASLKQILLNEINQVFGADTKRVTVSGDDVELSERHAHAFGLIFHELATNAAKYGAAIYTDGALSIDIRRSPGGGLTLDWVETAPNFVAPEKQNGFGARLIDMMTTSELGGAIERRAEPKGLALRITAPKV